MVHSSRKRLAIRWHRNLGPSVKASNGMQHTLLHPGRAPPSICKVNSQDQLFRHVDMLPSAKVEVRPGVPKCMRRGEGMILFRLEKTSSNSIESSSGYEKAHIFSFVDFADCSWVLLP